MVSVQDLLLPMLGEHGILGSRATKLPAASSADPLYAAHVAVSETTIRTTK